MADVENMIAVEFEGAVYAGGRHTRGSGYIKDCEKYNEGQVLGWIILRYADLDGLAKFPSQYVMALKRRV